MSTMAFFAKLPTISILAALCTASSLLLPVVAAFSFLPNHHGWKTKAAQQITTREDSSSIGTSSVLRSSSSSASGNGGDDDDELFEDREKERLQLEFRDLGPIQETEARKKRIQRDLKNRKRFAEFGDELWELRREMKMLNQLLVQTIANRKENDRKNNENNNNNNNRREKQQEEENETMIRELIRSAEQRDPELTYEVEMRKSQEAEKEQRIEDAAKHRVRAFTARSCLPQFNLEGLWIGKFGKQGYEMINITYAGDSLIAMTVTGGDNKNNVATTDDTGRNSNTGALPISRGEMVFRVDLSPVAHNNSNNRVASATGGVSKNSTWRLKPIVLTKEAAKQWGSAQLPRYQGMGKASMAATAGKNNRWMEGQLILIGEDYFSFAWVPLEEQIFFGRPSAELALKMLRKGGKNTLRDKKQKKKSWDGKAPPSADEKDMHVLQTYVESCFQKTTNDKEDYYGARRTTPGGDQSSNEPPRGCFE